MSAYCICCIYSYALQTTFIMRTNSMNPDQIRSSQIWVHTVWSKSYKWEDKKSYSYLLSWQQTIWTLIRLLLREQSDLGPYCLEHTLLKNIKRWESRGQLSWMVGKGWSCSSYHVFVITLRKDSLFRKAEFVICSQHLSYCRRIVYCGRPGSIHLLM